MKLNFHIILAILINLILIIKTQTPTQTTPNLFTLTDQNLLEFISTQNLVFIKFYVDWCPHCESLQKPFEDLAKTYTGKITFAQVNGDQNSLIMKKLHLEGFPNLLLFIKGFDNHLQYYGPVDEKQHIQEFLDAVLKKELKPYDSKEIEAVKDDESYYGFGIFCGNENTPEYENLKLAYQLTDNIRMFLAKDKETCGQFSLNNNKMVYKRKSGTIDRFSEFDNFQKLKQFLKFVRFDFVNDFTQDLIAEAIGSKIPLLIYVDPDSSSKNLKLLEELHVSIKNNFIVLHNKLAQPFEREYIELFGVKRSDTPVLYIGVIGRDIKKFKFNDIWTKANLAKFILDFIKNEVKPHRISQETPQNETGPVYTITANNMVEYLNNESQGKVLLFYYTGCNHCGEAVEMLESAANNKSESLNLKFGKINVAFNEIPQISNIPAIAYFPKGKADSGDFYQGTLDIKAFEDFLEAKVRDEKIGSEL